MHRRQELSLVQFTYVQKSKKTPRTLVLAAGLAVAAMSSAQTAPTPTATPASSGGAAAPTGNSATTASCAAAYGVYGPINGSSGGGGAPASSASSTPTVSVTQSNNGTGGGAQQSSSQQPTAGTALQVLHTGILTLGPDKASAFDVANALSGKLTGVTLTPLSPRSLLYTIDPTKVGKTVPASTPKLAFSVTVTDTAGKLTADTETILLKVLPPNAHNPGPGKSVDSKPAPNVLKITTRELPDAIANENYQASLQVVPKGFTVAWSSTNAPQGLTIDKPTGNVSGVLTFNTTTDEGVIRDRLEALIHELPAVDIDLQVFPLPDGYGHACDIVTAIGHQVRGVLSLVPIDDTRILAGIALNEPGPAENVEVVKRKLGSLIENLAITSVAPSPHVESVTTQLFYDRDAASVATAIAGAFPELKVSPIAMSATSAYADSLILADPTGTPRSSTLEQARRMITLIDQPRPQITVNAWSMQMSAQDEELMRPLVPEARRFAAGYNDALEKAIMYGWTYLNSQIAKGQIAIANGQIPPHGALDPVFAAYLCNRARWDWNDHRFTIGTTPPGACPASNALGYGLGYTDIFDRELPNLVQMMLLVVATTDPLWTADLTLDRMEGVTAERCCGWTTRTSSSQISLDNGNSCPECEETIQRRGSCQTADEDFYQSYDNQYEQNNLYTDNVSLAKSANFKKISPNFDKITTQHPPRHIAFACTRDRLEALLAPVPGVSEETKPLTTTSFLGQFRAALADFLFQYKMKTEYPDDFHPYLFPQSAARLDSTLTPLIEAFNEDMQALQQHLQMQLTYGIDRNKRLSYSSNGLITVSVISGNQATVQTQSLNYFPQNPTISLEKFAQALVGQVAGTQSSGTGSGGQAGSGTGQTGGGGGGAASAAAHLALGGSLATVVPALAAFGAAQPAQVTAKVGSGLMMTVTPYALSSNSGAELNVNVQYNENGAATLSSDPTQASSDDLNSRVSMHEVQTLVRMDALKFFEVSTLQSVIARQRAPYKLVEPLVVFPVLDGLGVFPRWRRRPEVIYNQSVIFLQASIMPTAADLGNSVRLQYDTVESCRGQLKEVRRGEDLNPDCSGAAICEAGLYEHCPHDQLARLMEYNRRIVRYFAGQYPVKAEPTSRTDVSSQQTCNKNCIQSQSETKIISLGDLPLWENIPGFTKMSALPEDTQSLEKHYRR